MKKGLFAVVILATVLAAAPDAMADHCFRCYNFTTCGPAQTGGKPVCDDSSGTCVFSGITCSGPHPFTDDLEAPLAADFVVASVERLDEPEQQSDAEVRVASLETKQPTAHR